MSEPLPSWDRPGYEAGGGNAYVLFALYGEFSAGSEVCRLEYRTQGLPSGIRGRRWTRAEGRELPLLEGEMARLARADMPELFDQLQSAPECLLIEGEVADPPDLNYLRDTIGLIAWWLDHGAAGVLDPQRLKLYDPVTWWLDVFAPCPPRVLNHVVLLASQDGGGDSWLRTRGMRKFGRPDLSMRGVSPESQPAIVELFNRLIVFQCHGGLIQEGQTARLAGLPEGITCHHGGTVEDPNFNNPHLELRWPTNYSF